MNRFSQVKRFIQRVRGLLSRRRDADGSVRPAAVDHAAIVFTDEQRQVIGLDRGRHLVLAPPGTGKTELLAQRMLLAVARGVDPARMIALTFTVRAARNMEARVVERAGARLPFVIGNVHRFCAEFLFERGILPANGSIIDEPTQREFMREVLDARDPAERQRLAGAHGQLPVGELLQVCCALRQRELGIPAGIAGDPRASALYRSEGPLVQTLARSFRAHKANAQVVDFDDLLNAAYVALVQQKRLAEADRFRWVQVDEIQDLSPLQWAIIAALQAPDAHCVYLGDREQAIYGFLGASLEQLASVARQCRIHYLQRNFRSPAYLLDVFVKYAEANLHPPWHESPLSADARRASPGDRLMLAIDGTAADQWPALAAFVRRPEQTARRMRQTAILVRDNRSADACGAAFEAAGIPVFKISGYDLMETALMRDIKACLAALQLQDDWLAWSRMFRLFGRMTSQRAARALVQDLRTASIHPADLLTDAHLRGRAGQAACCPRHGPAIDRFVGAFQPLLLHFQAEAGHGTTYREAITHLAGYLLQHGLVPDDAPAPEPVPSLLSSIEKFLVYTDRAFGRQTASVLFRDTLGVVNQLKEADLILGDERFVISTIHKAKGLEFDSVIIPGCVEGVYPHFYSLRAPDPAPAIDEDARLLYVAMTRARRQLVIAWPTRGDARPSRFLAPISACFTVVNIGV